VVNIYKQKADKQVADILEHQMAPYDTAMAQVFATLALVEEQRQANEIAKKGSK